MVIELNASMVAVGVNAHLPQSGYTSEQYMNCCSFFCLKNATVIQEPEIHMFVGKFLTKNYTPTFPQWSKFLVMQSKMKRML